MPSTGSELPYEPSAPCAACARGVDPLRAACVSLNEQSVRYFCSRACREQFFRAEAEHAEHASAPPAHPADGREPTGAYSALSLGPVARRIAPTRPSTPLWPLVTSAVALPLHELAGLAGATAGSRLAQLAVAAVIAVGLAFARATPMSRRHGGLMAWLAAPLGIASLGIADLFAPSSALALAAGAGVVLMWLREHLIERSEAALSARRQELAARLSPRVRLALPPREGQPAPTVEQELERVREGDEVWVEAPLAVPVDGVVVAGTAEVLPYPLARAPIERRAGASLLAGAQLVSGAVRVRATRVGPARTLFRALAEPVRGEPLPALMRFGAQAHLHAVWALLALLLPSLGTARSLGDAFARMGAAFLALPALALVRGARAPWQSALRSASARGVSFRDLGSIERAGRVDTAVLPVEGALIEESYALAQVCPLGREYGARELLAWALAAESAAEEHPLARAVREHAAGLGVAPALLRRLVPLPGRGISALTDGQGNLVFGSREALLAAGVSVAVADREAQEAEQAGQKVVFLAVGGHLRGLFVFAQTIRGEARVAVQTLFDLGLEVEIVSGDHRATVASIARALDVTQVKAELSGAQRAGEVRRLRDGEARVAALGTLPADEALLAAADLALVLDGAGQPSEHDLATASSDLRDAAAAFSLARRARRLSRGALASCGLGACLALAAAAGVIAPLWAIALATLVDLSCLRPATLEPRASARPAAR